jgi:MerR family transcriptional regulator, redox-sensitive transcriptional activator SoxR
MKESSLSIGEVARRAGVNASAIRYYERAGVLPPPARMRGQRRYTDEALDRLSVIDVAKRAGFSLDEVRVLLSTTDAGAPAHEQLRSLASRKLPEVEALIERAEAMRAWLTVAQGCQCPTLDVCSLFATSSARADAGSSDAETAAFPITQVSGRSA